MHGGVRHRCRDTRTVCRRLASARVETARSHCQPALHQFRHLSASSRGALMAETESIWAPGHVRLKWLRESTVADEGITLRVLVVARPVAQSEYAPWTVAELVRPRGLGGRRHRLHDRRSPHRRRGALAAAAPRVSSDVRPPPRRRAGPRVAHEIGHYLLQTNTHARRGLMRARIDAREFADLRSGSFPPGRGRGTDLAGACRPGRHLARRR